MKNVSPYLIVVASTLFVSVAQAQFVPGGVSSAGLTSIVPDRPVWWNQTGNYYTNGPINNVADEAINLANWEPNISVLSDCIFLVGANTYADDGALANQNFVVTLQPVAGGAPKAVYEFYTDTNTPFKGPINLSRQNGNPQRVAGDKRYGAVNYITAAESSPGQLGEFQSDTRWTSNLIYQANNRYVAVQPFSLNTSTLVPTPLYKAFDAVYGNFVDLVNPPLTQPEVSRTGGTVACLDNGNFVVVIHDKTAFSNPAGNVTTFGIVTPAGVVVKTNTLVDPRDIWDNVCAYKGGFAVRCHDTIYFHDNAGNLQGSSPQSSSGFVFDTGRGDGTRIASDIRSPYVFIAAKTPDAEPNELTLMVWDSRTTNFVTSAVISQTDTNLHDLDRVNIAADALDRVCVAYELKPDKVVFPLFQVAARVMAFDGTNITFLTPTFFPFLNHDVDTNNILGYRTFRPSVAMTTRQICIAAKGEINSTNNPASGPDTTTETTVYTVISHPAPTPQLKVTLSGSNVVLSWDERLGPFTLQSTPAISPASWADVSPQPPIVAVGGQNTMTVAQGSGNVYFRLTKNCP